MAGGESFARSCGAREKRLARRQADRLPSRPPPGREPDVVFAFQDGDEIGPRMLARIARQTGLLPEDL